MRQNDSMMHIRYFITKAIIGHDRRNNEKYGNAGYYDEEGISISYHLRCRRERDAMVYHQLALLPFELKPAITKSASSDQSSKSIMK